MGGCSPDRFGARTQTYGSVPATLTVGGAEIDASHARFQGRRAGRRPHPTFVPSHLDGRIGEAAVAERSSVECSNSTERIP
jgi:hypothetical protein